MSKNYIAYYRVSTARQGESGLGLESQKFNALQFALGRGEIVAEYVEVESGRKCDREQLGNAIAHCKRTGSTLLIAKLDRLARNVFFVASLMESKVDFVCLDNPNATPFVIHILAAVAEQEAKAISERTRSALASLKRRGVRLGNPRPDVLKLNQGATNAKQTFAAKMAEIVKEIQSTGVQTLQGIADCLNRRGYQTRTGKTWYPASVRNLLAAITQPI